MKNRVQTEMPKASELPAITNEMTELTDAELQAVSGGLIRNHCRPATKSLGSCD